MKAKEAWNGLLDDIKMMKHLTNIRQKKDILDKLDILRLVLVDYEEMKKEIIARQETENSLTQWVADLTTELEELKATVKELLDIPFTVSTVNGTSLLIKTMNKLQKLVGAKDE